MFPGRESTQNPIQICAVTFFYPDYTVGSGVTPDHARFPNKESDVPKQARGLYHRSGIAPCPEGYISCDVIIATQITPVNSIMDLWLCEKFVLFF